jgi:cytochrome b
MRKKELEHIIEGFESEAELLQIAFAELEEKYLELLVAATAIHLATVIEGKKPKRHKKIMFNHRVEWPYLWQRIDEMIKVLNKHN